ncbi:hypothetical protein [Methylotuvimicrobium alcaliphilum]|uniref:hypothetical protein n=1 Tax=Methylotuvimicrobium alcaliphilum TaxID=271065 RepID=UPI00139244D8|nr:hypothetical protein [Methylotuvimicrobium alcaliphilum]
MKKKAWNINELILHVTSCTLWLVRNIEYFHSLRVSIQTPLANYRNSGVFVALISANLVPILWCVYGFIRHIGMGCRYPCCMDVVLRIAIRGPGFRQSLAE